MTSDDDNLTTDDGLERAIRGALERDADSASVARLERFWRRGLRRQTWRRRAVGAASLAAAVLVAVAAWLVVRPERDGAPPMPVAQGFGGADAGSQLAGAPVEAARSEVAVPPAGRPATTYERFMFVARSSPPRAVRTPTATLDEVVERLVKSPHTDARQVLASTRLPPGDVETQLLRRLSKATEAEQAAIVRLLAARGTRRSVPALVRLAEEESLRRSALAAIEDIVGVEGLGQVVRRAEDPAVRAAVLARLLALNPQKGLPVYLALVSDNATRREALAAAEASPRLPVEALLEKLDDEHKSVRWAAATVLGHVDGPEITRRLIARFKFCLSFLKDSCCFALKSETSFRASSRSR